MGQTPSPPVGTGPELPRQARAVRTRDAILEGAASEFADAGYQGASLSGILERSGVTKGALYFHFTSKESIALALVDEMESACHALTARVTDLPVDPLRRAAMLSRDVLDALRGPPMFRAGQRLCGDGLGEGARYGWPWVYWQDVFAGLFVDAREKGLLRPQADPIALGRFVVDISGGAFSASLAVSGLTDLPERVRQNWDLLFTAVAIDPWLAAWVDDGGMATVLGGPREDDRGGGG